MGYYIEKALLKWIFRFALLVPFILIYAGGVTSHPTTESSKSFGKHDSVFNSSANLTETDSSTKMPHIAEFSCPYKCECNNLSENQLELSCNTFSSSSTAKTNTDEPQRDNIVNLEGVDQLIVRGCNLLDSISITSLIPTFQDNILKELELHQVAMEPALFFNSAVFQKSKLSLKKLSIHKASNPNNSPVAETTTSFSALRHLDSLTLCDSSPELSKFVLRSLPAVSSIKFVNNSITEVDLESLAHLSLLKSLNLSYNNIQSFPSALSNRFHSLENLDVSHNHIAHLQERVFEGLSSLIQLDISHNQIQYIDTEVFTPLTNIEYIDLSYNDVIQFFEPYFQKNTQLRTLRMADAWVPKTFMNEETALRSRLEIERLINTLQTVETLDISDNNMTIIPETLTHAPRLVRVHLKGNRWECSCQDRWLSNWISTTDVSPLKDTEHVWCHNNTSKDRVLLSDYLKKLPTSCNNVDVTARTPFKYYAVLGKDTLLQCHPQRDPYPSVIWITPSKRFVSFSDNESDIQNITETESFTTVLANGTLQISNITAKDYGLYLCIASYSDLNITHYVHLGIDVSIFSDVRIASIIIGWITSFSFLFAVLITQLVRNLLDRCGLNCLSVSPANQSRRVRTFFESMEQNKNYQLDWLRDNYNMQAKKIRDNCVQQLERIRESYQTQTKNLCDIREYGTQQLHTVRDQYYDQIRKVSGYSAQQLCRVRENYLFQRNRVGKFSSHQLLRLRETYKWQAQTLNKILENLPRTLNFDTCRGMGACGRTDSIYLNNISDSTMEESSMSERDESGSFPGEKMEHISLLIPPEFVSQYIMKNSETPIAMEETFLAKITLEDYNDKPCCSNSLRKGNEENREV